MHLFLAPLLLLTFQDQFESKRTRIRIGEKGLVTRFPKMALLQPSSSLTVGSGRSSDRDGSQRGSTYYENTWVQPLVYQHSTPRFRFVVKANVRQQLSVKYNPLAPTITKKCFPTRLPIVNGVYSFQEQHLADPSQHTVHNVRLPNWWEILESCQRYLFAESTGFSWSVGHLRCQLDFTALTKLRNFWRSSSFSH